VAGGDHRSSGGGDVDARTTSSVASSM
jgi:hypothetical protein